MKNKTDIGQMKLPSIESITVSVNRQMDEYTTIKKEFKVYLERERKNGCTELSPTGRFLMKNLEINSLKAGIGYSLFGTKGKNIIKAEKELSVMRGELENVAAQEIKLTEKIKDLNKMIKNKDVVNILLADLATMINDYKAMVQVVKFGSTPAQTRLNQAAMKSVVQQRHDSASSAATDNATPKSGSTRPRF